MKETEKSKLLENPESAKLMYILAIEKKDAFEFLFSGIAQFLDKLKNFDLSGHLSEFDLFLLGINSEESKEQGLDELNFLKCLVNENKGKVNNLLDLFNAESQGNKKYAKFVTIINRLEESKARLFLMFKSLKEKIARGIYNNFNRQEIEAMRLLRQIPLRKDLIFRCDLEYKMQESGADICIVLKSDEDLQKLIKPLTEIKNKKKSQEIINLLNMLKIIESPNSFAQKKKKIDEIEFTKQELEFLQSTGSAKLLTDLPQDKGIEKPSGPEMYVPSQYEDQGINLLA